MGPGCRELTVGCSTIKVGGGSCSARPTEVGGSWGSRWRAGGCELRAGGSGWGAGGGTG